MYTNIQFVVELYKCVAISPCSSYFIFLDQRTLNVCIIVSTLQSFEQTIVNSAQFRNNVDRSFDSPPISIAIVIWNHIGELQGIILPCPHVRTLSTKLKWMAYREIEFHDEPPVRSKHASHHAINQLFWTATLFILRWKYSTKILLYRTDSTVTMYRNGKLKIERLDIFFINWSMGIYLSV